MAEKLAVAVGKERKKKLFHLFLSQPFESWSWPSTVKYFMVVTNYVTNYVL
jgi:hypothetical protein